MNKKGANVSPCSNPAVMSKSSVSPSGDITLALVLQYVFSMVWVLLRKCQTADRGGRTLINSIPKLSLLI